MMYSCKEIEKDVQKLWKKKNIPEQIVEMDWKKKKFYLLDGPPYVNGIPHVGHVKTTTFKDIWGKFKYMQGYSVWFQPGFDCGGLPIENAVEKKLKIKSKSDIEKKIGVDTFIDECKKFAKGNEPKWLELYKAMGAWRGWLTPYLTSEDYYLESGWWTVKNLFEKGMLVEGFRPGFWCPKCETVLAGYEVTDSYKDLEDYSVFIKFPVGGKEKEFFLVWTTTPWTLPANVAICVHPDEIYVKIEMDGEILILAEKRLEIFEHMGLGYTILDRMKGKELEGIKYEPVLDVPVQEELKKISNAHQVIASIKLMKKRVASKIQEKKGIETEDEFDHIVTMDTGSGIVHIAPGHGDVDNQIGKHYNLPEISPVDERGCLTEEAGEFAGIFVKDADEKIIKKLKETGRLLHSGKIVHSYPLCWRCKQPLIYRMSKQWFLKIDSAREKMISESNHTAWLPGFAKERFNNLLAEAPDWAVTRQRYWGIPLPVWICEGCGSKSVIGSRAELKERAIEKIDEKGGIHKNVVDKIHLKCQCGSKMNRDPNIMDVWFDSGISPWASLGYPYANKAIFEKLWPADLIDESQDQIRGWFYTLMFCGVTTFNSSPYKIVCLNGWTLDEKGDKMSKSLGNVILAEDACSELGADALRLYYCHDVAPWETQKFSLKNAQTVGRSLNTLWNTYVYFKTYCRKSEDKKNLQIEDEWILSKLNSLMGRMTEDMEKFHFHSAGRNVMNFIVNDFSRTYIKIIRDRSDNGVDYIMTEVLEKVARILAPIAPFISEYIYNDIFSESVHLQSWPNALKSAVNEELEKEMGIVEEVFALSSAIRKENDIKLRWPLQTLYLSTELKNNKLYEIIKKLCNVKEVGIGAGAGIKKEGERCSITLDTTIIEDEALLRELLREVQSKRKAMKLVVGDKIKLILDNEDLNKFEAEIKEHVGAREIVYRKIDKPLGKVEYKETVIKFKFEKV